MLKLKVFFTVILLSSINTFSQNATKLNTLTSKEQADGWKLLFDGTTKNGWHVFNNKTDGSAWKVADGVLYLDTKARGPKGEGAGDIISDQEFENYHLSLEWKVDSAGNSGLIIQAQEDPKYRYAWVTGPEIQIIDNNAHPDAKNNKHRDGDLYDLIAATPETVKPISDWNVMEVIANKGNLEIHLNGTKVVSTTQWDDNWAKMISESKFKSMADFGKFKKGKISLQDHGNAASFMVVCIWVP